MQTEARLLVIGHGETFNKQNDVRKMSKWCESNMENPQIYFFVFVLKIKKVKEKREKNSLWTN